MLDSSWRRNRTLHVATAAVSLVLLLLYARSVAAGRLTHGFVAYHTAAQLLVEGRLGAHVYDQDWFIAEVQRRTGTAVIEIFGPNPPTMALIALPLAGLDARTARAVWLVVSIVALAATVLLLARAPGCAPGVWGAIAVAVVMLDPPALANLRTGQAYLLIGVCFAAATLALSRGDDAIAGLWLGLAFVLKTAAGPWLLLLLLLRRWRSVAVAAITIIVVALAALPWTGMAMWREYPLVVASSVSQPTTGLTAYQTTLGFFRHWCGASSTSSSFGGCAAFASVTAAGMLAAAVAITVRVVRHAPPLLMSAAGVLLSLLGIPIAEDHQFALLAVPVLVLAGSRPHWTWIVMAVLLLAPAQLTIERYTSGGLSALAYPRLYATWALWVCGIAAAAGHSAPRAASTGAFTSSTHERRGRAS
jgi:hypothetical protein